MLFTEKYFPNSFNEFIGNSSIVKESIATINSWNNKSKPLFFYGPPGTGKTCLALLLAKELGLELLEMNASDLRNKERIQNIAVQASQTNSLTGRKRLILIDEIDCMQRIDRAWSSAINELITKTRNPLIFTANNAFVKNLEVIRSKCKLMQFKKVNYLSIGKKLKEISEKEKKVVDEVALIELAKRSNGDVRSALLDLQLLGKEITMEKVKILPERDQEQNIFIVLKEIFKAKDLMQVKKIVSLADQSHDMLKQWIQENLAREFKNPAKAFDVLSKADVFEGRIMKKQYYGFLKYSTDLMTLGINHYNDNKNGFTQYRFPELLKSLKSSLKERTLKKLIAEKASKKMHCSAREFIKQIPYYKVMLENKENEMKIINYFGLEEKEIEFLIGRKARKKIKSIEEEKIVEENKEKTIKIKENQTKLCF